VTQAAALADALHEARRQLGTQPALAERQAEAILRIIPGQAEALLILGVAHRNQGRLIEALALLKPLARTTPDDAEVHFEWGLTQLAMGLVQSAILSLRRAVALAPENPGAWRILGGVLLRAGDAAMADVAYQQQVRHAMRDVVLRDVAAAVDAGELSRAEQLLRTRVSGTPDDVAALRMLSEIRLHAGDYAAASSLAGQCLSLSPTLMPARMTYAAAMLYQGQAAAARPHVERLMAEHPDDPRILVLGASLLAMTGDRAGAVEQYRAVLRHHPGEPNTWLRLGHVLRTSGRAQEAVAAYRQAAVLEPSLGDAYWSLANLKTDVFTPDDIAVMQAQVERTDISDEDRVALHYALGSALERSGDYAGSFEHYAAGARRERQHLEYSAEQTTALVSRCRTVMDEAFFAARQRGGDPDPAPIFVVGLPRSGSTLVEQILASHSAVEGTSELRAISIIAEELGWQADDERYPQCLAALSESDRAAWGRRYIDRTRQHRLTDRPYFIDKMPDNFLHAGLIQLILPHAKVVDIRRAPMAACFSAFKQLFARGTVFSYDLRELGLYYRDYVALMAHFEEVLPGRFHRVRYETLVTDTEQEVRRLLAYCGLPFESGCLRFHENARDVTTASSEQVRKPIFTEALDHWRRYEPWLGELQAALGDLA
jgi:tetratricopeptide (TPR) repeat protein